MSRTELFLSYLQHYADKNLQAIAAMLADEVTLRDWKISVRGKPAVLAETAKNFGAAQSVQIEALRLYEGADSVAGELRILVDGSIELFVVDVIRFGADGRILAVRAYLGRGDE